MQHNSGDGAIQNSGPYASIVQIEKLLLELSESTLQANFYAATGIRCGMGARRAIEVLLQMDFDGYAVGDAWNLGMLRWDNKEKRLWVKIGWTELFLGLALLFYFGSLGLTAILFLIEGVWWRHGNGLHFALFCGLAALLTASGIATNRHVLKPFNTARDVQKALKELAQQNSHHINLRL